MISPSSPGFVPSVGTNIEVSDDIAVMETYLQRPQHAANMKRPMADEDSDEEDEIQVQQRSVDGQETTQGRIEKPFIYTGGKYLHKGRCGSVGILH